MGSAPAFDFAVDRRAMWRAAVGALVMLSCVVMGLWWANGPPVSEPAALLVVCTVVVLALGAGSGLVRGQHATRLRWDGRIWTAEFAAGEAQVGEITAALDLGAWMLLRFHSDGRPGPLHACWIPVQCPESDLLWHAMRCAVHGRGPGADARV